MTELLLFTNVVLAGCLIVVMRGAYRIDRELRIIKDYAVTVTRFASETCGGTPTESSKKVR